MQRDREGGDHTRKIAAPSRNQNFNPNMGRGSSGKNRFNKARSSMNFPSLTRNFSSTGIGRGRGLLPPVSTAKTSQEAFYSRILSNLFEG